MKKSDLEKCSVKGRYEAMNIIMGLDPEAALEDCIDCYSIADTGDYGYTWNVVKLKEKFNVDLLDIPSPLERAVDVAEGMFWELAAKEDRNNMFKDLVKRLVNQIDNGRIEEGRMSALSAIRTYIV